MCAPLACHLSPDRERFGVADLVRVAPNGADSKEDKRKGHERAAIYTVIVGRGGICAGFALCLGKYRLERSANNLA